MRPSPILITLLAVSALALAGCARWTTDPAAAPPRAPLEAAAGPTTSSGAHLTTATSLAPTGTPTTSPTAPAAAPGAQVWPTGPRVTPETGPPALLTAIRTGEHAAFDRVTFQFRGGVPGYDIRYVPKVTQDGSGQPVTLRGRAFVQVVFRHASAAEQGLAAPPHDRLTSTGPATITTGFASLRQLKAAGDYEGYLSFGLGLDQRAGFRVVTLTNPARVAVDIARPAAR